MEHAVGACGFYHSKMLQANSAPKIYIKIEKKWENLNFLNGSDIKKSKIKTFDH